MSDTFRRVVARAVVVALLGCASMLLSADSASAARLRCSAGGCSWTCDSSIWCVGMPGCDGRGGCYWDTTCPSELRMTCFPEIDQ